MGEIKTPLIKNCDECNKEVFLTQNRSIIIQYEDYQRKVLHDTHKCYNYKHFKKLFERLEEDIQLLKGDLKKIQEVMFWVSITKKFKKKLVE